MRFVAGSSKGLRACCLFHGIGLCARNDGTEEMSTSYTEDIRELSAL